MDNMKRTRDTIPGENSAESCAYWHASCTKAMPHVMLQTQPTISKNVPSCRSAERMLRRQATTGRLILVVVPQQNTLNADNSVPTHAHAHTRTRTHTHTHTPATQSLCLVCLDMTTMFFWATVCKTIRPTLSDRWSVCPVRLSVCLSVTLVHCGQTVAGSTWNLACM